MNGRRSRRIGRWNGNRAHLPTRAQTDLQALASYARSAVETVTEAPPVDHGELPPGLDARPPPPLTTAPVAADGWAVSTLPGEVLFARTNARLQDYVRRDARDRTSSVAV